MSHDFARSQRLKKESAQRQQQQPARRKNSSNVPSWMWVLVGTLLAFLIMFLVYLSGVRPPLPPMAANESTPAVAPVTEPSAPQQPVPPQRVSPVFEFYNKLPAGGPPITDIQSDTVAPASATGQAAPVGPVNVDPAAPIADVAPASTPAAAETAAAPSNTVEVPAQPKPISATTPSAVPVSSSKPVPTDEPLDPIEQLLAQKEKEKSVAKTATTQPKAATGGARYLQAGVFRNKAEADKLRSKMARLGVGTSVQTVTNASGDSLQKVLAGPFASAQALDEAKSTLGRNGINTIAVK